MSEDVRAIAEAGIRKRNPGYSSAEVKAALLAAILGRELASRVRQIR